MDKSRTQEWLSLERIVGVGRALLLIGALGYILVYLFIAARRMAYPFELEWMEGGSVVHVQRVMQGQTLYTSPSLGFVSYIYTPLYFYVSAFVARIIGIGFLPLRLVSFLSSLGCFALLFYIVYRRTTSRYTSFLAVGLFAATFQISGSWFDLARVDTLFLLFLLAGVYTFDSPRWSVRNVVSPTLLFLSFFTKQTALTVGVCLAGASLLTRKRSERFWFSAIFVVLLGGSLLLMNTLTEGWYGFYVFHLPTQHELLELELVRFWTNDVAQPMAVSLIIGLVPFFRLASSEVTDQARLMRDVLILGGLFLASYIARIHAGGFDNVLMPVYAGIAMYFGIGWSQSQQVMGQNNKLSFLLVLAAVIQFAGLVYPPGQQVPTTKNHEQGEELLRRIADFDGEVYLSDHPWYLEVLDKPSQAQDMALRDIVRASEVGEWKQTLKQEMAAAVGQGRYEAFIVDFRNFTLRPPNFEEHYDLVEMDISGGLFHPVAGWDRSPTYLYVRRSEP